MRLPDETVDEIWAEVMERLSSVWTQIPIGKAQLRALLGLLDQELEAAEISIVQALPASDAKSWLVNHPTIGRRLMLAVLEERKEVL